MGRDVWKWERFTTDVDAGGWFLARTEKNGREGTERGSGSLFRFDHSARNEGRRLYQPVIGEDGEGDGEGTIARGRHTDP